MEMVKVNGAELSSMTMGKGPMLVFAHGLVSGSMASWYFSQAVPLSSAHRVVLYDQRGHGESTISASGYDLETQVADLCKVIAFHERRHTGQVDVVGHSMGALIALQFALKYPKKVRKLALVDAPLPAVEHVAPSLLSIKSKDMLRVYIDRLFPSATSGRRKARLYDRLSQLFFASTLVKDVLTMDAPSARALASLTLPVLLLYGNASPCLDAGFYLQEKLPIAHLQTLDCGHYIPEEAPKDLLSALRLFLNEDIRNTQVFAGATA